MRIAGCLHSAQDWYVDVKDGSVGCSECDEALRTTPSEAEIIKRCDCGRFYTQETWPELVPAYEQTFEWGEIHEARHCLCGSTIVIVRAKGDFEAYARKREETRDE